MAQNLSKPSNAPLWIWEELLGKDKQVTATWVSLATAKERGVALATDEMRGYPDKNATGTHLGDLAVLFQTDSCRHDSRGNYGARDSGVSAVEHILASLFSNTG